LSSHVAGRALAPRGARRSVGAWSAAFGCLALASCNQFARVGAVDLDAGDSGSQTEADSSTGPSADAGDAPVVVRLSDCGPDNPAGLSASAIAALLQGGPSETSQRMLYPYEGTVFPGGPTQPLLMWEGPAAEAVLIRLRSASFEYTGCLSPSAAGQVAIPERAWSALQASNTGAEHAVQLELTTLAGERASGPIARSITIASAPLPVAITYMAYGSTGTPALNRVRLGQPAQLVFSPTDCSGCHSVSAQGSRLLGYSKGSGSAHCLDAAAVVEPPLIRAQLPGAELAALTPDGALYVAPGHPATMGTQTRGVPVSQATLFEVASGAAVPRHNVPPGAMVPVFSPDGALLAFNDFAIDGGRGLALMDFDLGARAAGNYRVLYRDSASYPGWPSFTPDAQQLVFARGSTTDFSANGAYIVRRIGVAAAPSDLFRVELAGGDALLLARAMGFSTRDAADAESYLPFGAEDLHKNYYPQTAPVTAGGYAWVFFDSIRHYGNQGMKRQIWGAALDLSAGPDDPSRPPFHVPGQDAATSNLRAVPAVDPDANASCSR
jgi:hypothetical protein